MSRTIAIHKTRIGGSKVRTGCRTCKARRVKCDEGKPHCQRCTKAGRNCEGYMSSHQQITPPAGYKFVHYVQHGQARSTSDVTSPSSSICISRSPSPLADLDLSALRSLEFYVHSTAVQLGEPFGIDVFSKGLAQLMHNDPAVRHALIALAAFHENLTHHGVPVFNEQRRLLALDHYNKSIQAVVHLNQSGSDRSSLITLITCLLYCAIESVQGHFTSSMKHISSGILLLAEQEDDLLLQERLGYGVNGGFIDTLRRLFVSLGGQAMEMSDVAIDEATVAYLLSSVDAPVVDYEITTTEQAMAHVSHLTNDVIRFLVWAMDTSGDPDFPSKELVQVGDQLELRMDKWPSTYHKLRETLTKKTSPGYHADHTDHAALLILRINQTINRLFLRVRFSKSPLVFDDFLEDFQSIVAAAEEFFEVEARQKGSPNPANSPHAADAAASEPIFTLALGIIPALFTTATRCRDSRTRRRALHLLKTSRRRESIWDAKIVSVVAERVVEIEEAGAIAYWRQQAGREGPVDITKAEHIPEMARVQQLDVGFHGAEDEALVSFLDRMGSALQTHWLSWDEAHNGGCWEPTSGFRPPHDAGELLPPNR